MKYPNEPGFAKNSDTSQEAAESLNDANKLRNRVLQFIKEHKNATCWEVEQGLDLRHQTASARIRELYLKGYIMDSGERRLTDSKRKATVWRVDDYSIR